MWAAHERRHSKQEKKETLIDHLNFTASDNYIAVAFIGGHAASEVTVTFESLKDTFYLRRYDRHSVDADHKTTFTHAR